MKNFDKKVFQQKLIFQNKNFKEGLITIASTTQPGDID